MTFEKKLHSEHTDLTQEEQSQITSLKEKIQICRMESHGIPLLLIQNAKALQEEKKQLQQHINKVRETYFNDIQVRFEQQSPEAQSVFAQASIIESAFDLDTVEAIASLNTMKSNYWLMDALEELLRSSFLSLQEHRFLYLHSYENSPIVFECRDSFQCTVVSHSIFRNLHFFPMPTKNFNLDNFVEKKRCCRKRHSNGISECIYIQMEHPFGKSRTGIGWYLVSTWTIATRNSTVGTSVVFGVKQS